MSDIFTVSLLEAKFRDVSFPITDFRIQITHDIAQHKRPDQDGARVESTGRNPLMFSASIPFTVGLARGVTENWPDLYPAHHRRFLAAMADRSTGVLVCPSFGAVKVKPVSCSTSISSIARGGETVAAEWMEYSEIEDESQALFTNASPLNAALDEAKTLDDALEGASLKDLDPDPKSSLLDAMNFVAAVFDTATLLAKRAVAVIDRITYRLNRIHESITGLMDPQLWDVKQSILRMRDALIRLKMLGSGVTKDVSLYVVPEPTTVGNLAARLQTTVTLLIELNPNIVRLPIVDRRTVVRYYRVDVNPAVVAAVTGGISPLATLV